MLHVITLTHEHKHERLRTCAEALLVSQLFIFTPELAPSRTQRHKETSKEATKRKNEWKPNSPGRKDERPVCA